MAKLEELKRGAAVRGILPECLVTVADDPAGKPGVELLYREREPALEIVEARPGYTPCRNCHDHNWDISALEGLVFSAGSMDIRQTAIEAPGSKPIAAGGPG
jgi:hypothetical protein